MKFIPGFLSWPEWRATAQTAAQTAALALALIALAPALTPAAAKASKDDGRDGQNGQDGQTEYLPPVNPHPSNLQPETLQPESGILARGTVFLDADGDGRRGAGETGLAGVLVSNGREIAATDAAGAWALPHDDETIFFVIKPAGYMTPTDEFNVPRFYYIHQPAGTPPHVMKYRGIAPTGPLPASIDFALHPAPDEGRDFTALIMGDPQPRDLREIEYIRDDIVAQLLHHPARFAIALGDIMFDDLRHYDDYNEVMRWLGAPLYNIPGNHDMNFDCGSDRYALESWKAAFGPRFYSFNYGDVHFVVLDNVEFLRLNDVGKEEYRGRIGEEQLAWLREDLKHVPPEHLIVLMHHIPLKTTVAPTDPLNTTDRLELFKVLEGRERVLDLAAHTHMTEHLFLGPEDGWNGPNPIHCMQATPICGSWWGGPKDERGIPITDQQDGTPNGWHMFQFRGNAYSERYQAAYRPARFQIRVSKPRGTVKADAVSSTPVVVNIFNGSARHAVEAWVDGQAIPLTRTLRPDPWWVKTYNHYRPLFSEWTGIFNSTHLWVGNLPPDIGLGTHIIHVRTVDQYGQVFTGGGIFEVE